MGELDLSQIVAIGLSQAKWLGLALLSAGVLVRLAGKALGHMLFFGAVLAAAGLAYHEWQVLHSLLVSGGIVLGAVVVFGLLAWVVRGISFLFGFVLVAAGFYLLAYGWMGPSFANTTTGALVWAGATIATMIATGLKGSLLRHAPAAALGAGLLR